MSYRTPPGECRAIQRILCHPDLPTEIPEPRPPRAPPIPLDTCSLPMDDDIAVFDPCS